VRNEYWLLLPWVALAERRAHKKLYEAWLADMTQKDDEIHQLVKSVEEARQQRDKLNRENAELYALNTDMQYELTDAQREIKALQRQTIQVEEVPVKRTTRTKKVNP